MARLVYMQLTLVGLEIFLILLRLGRNFRTDIVGAGAPVFRGKLVSPGNMATVIALAQVGECLLTATASFVRDYAWVVVTDMCGWVTGGGATA
jgi:hypothetical protein